MALAACSGDGEVVAPPTTGFDGAEIHVEGVVTRVRDLHVVELGGNSQDRVVVIAREEHRLRVGDRAEAVGRLQRLDIAVVERQLRIDLSPAVLADVEGESVLVTERVHRR